MDIQNQFPAYELYKLSGAALDAAVAYLLAITADDSEESYEAAADALYDAIDGIDQEYTVEMVLGF